MNIESSSIAAQWKRGAFKATSLATWELTQFRLQQRLVNCGDIMLSSLGKWTNDSNRNLLAFIWVIVVYERVYLLSLECDREMWSWFEQVVPCQPKTTWFVPSFRFLNAKITHLSTLWCLTPRASCTSIAEHKRTHGTHRRTRGMPKHDKERSAEPEISAAILPRSRVCVCVMRNCCDCDVAEFPHWQIKMKNYDLAKSFWKSERGKTEKQKNTDDGCSSKRAMDEMKAPVRVRIHWSANRCHEIVCVVGAMCMPWMRACVVAKMVAKFTKVCQMGIFRFLNKGIGISFIIKAFASGKDHTILHPFSQFAITKHPRISILRSLFWSFRKFFAQTFQQIVLLQSVRA